MPCDDRRETAYVCKTDCRYVNGSDVTPVEGAELQPCEWREISAGVREHFQRSSIYWQWEATSATARVVDNAKTNGYHSTCVSDHFLWSTV